MLVLVIILMVLEAIAVVFWPPKHKIMEKQRYNQLMRDESLKLTKEEFKDL